jgi:cyclase
MLYKNLFAMVKESLNRVANADMLLWNYLRTRPDGFTFRRQYALGSFLADFYCHRLKLVIEVSDSLDPAKETMEPDTYRQQLVEGDGIKFIRFTRTQIEADLENVINELQDLLYA